MTVGVSELSVREADYADDRDAGRIVQMMREYARDPMGGGEDLPQEVLESVVPALRAMPTAFSLLALDGERAVGLANCFLTLSTFAARPVVNVHDFVVRDGHRGRGLGRRLFAGIEAAARERGACKVTLEVLDGNEPAKRLYASLGFGEYKLDAALGGALFWQKAL